MKHRFGYNKLNRNSAQRKSLLRNLNSQLIVNGRIVTTLEKAKALRSVVEKLVSLARVDSVANRRLASTRVFGDEAVRKLFGQVGPANKSRPGGYTRIMKLGFRAGDRARRAVIEFVEPSLIVGEESSAETAKAE